MSQELLDTTIGSSSTRVIAYEKAEIVPGIAEGTWFLVVSGEAPCVNMKVSLAPRIYVSCPEYWGIEVVGTLPGGFCLTAMRPYSEVIPLGGVTGSKGIEVIGSNQQQTFDVSGGCS
jgi:hypothetical protein